jgi:hypothetical protein
MREGGEVSLPCGASAIQHARIRAGRIGFGLAPCAKYGGPSNHGICRVDRLEAGDADAELMKANHER